MYYTKCHKSIFYKSPPVCPPSFVAFFPWVRRIQIFFLLARLPARRPEQAGSLPGSRASLGVSRWQQSLAPRPAVGPLISRSRVTRRKGETEPAAAEKKSRRDCSRHSHISSSAPTLSRHQSDESADGRGGGRGLNMTEEEERGFF